MGCVKFVLLQRLQDTTGSGSGFEPQKRSGPSKAFPGDNLWYVFLIKYIVFDISFLPSLKGISQIYNVVHTNYCTYDYTLWYVMDAAMAKWSGTEGDPFRNDLTGGTRSWRNRGFRFLDGACSIEQCVPAEVYTNTIPDDFVTGPETSWKWKHYSLPTSRISRYQINTDIFTSSMSDLVLCASGYNNTI